jgi:hypothetical protein
MREDKPERAVVTLEELRNLVGHLDPATAVEILALEPTYAELEQAAMWLRGQGNLPDRAGHPLGGKAAAIYEMLATEEEDRER